MSWYITLFEIAAFLASLAAWKQLKRSSYLRWFPLLLLLVTAVESYETFWKPPQDLFNAFVYNIQIPLQHLLYLVILYFALESPVYRRLAIGGSIVLVVVSVTTLVYATRPGHFNVLAYSVGAVLLILFIILRFYEMLQHPIGFNFLKEPFFYMLFACLLFHVGTLPVFATGNWLYESRQYRHILFMLMNVMSLLNYVLYATYTIAFIWIMRRKYT